MISHQNHTVNSRVYVTPPPTVINPEECPDTPPRTVTFDGAVEALLNEVRPHPQWGVTAVVDYIRRVNEFLAGYEFPEGDAPDDVLKAVFQKVARRLKQCGHTPETPAAYVKGFKRSLEMSRRSHNLPGAGRGSSRRGPGVAYDAVVGGPDCPVDDPAEWGTYRVGDGGEQHLTNCCLLLDEKVHSEDGSDVEIHFVGRFVMNGKTQPFTITPDDYANEGRLKAALYAAGGPTVQIRCKIEEFRNAVAHLSRPRTTRVTTNFGWNADCTEFLTPAGVVTAGGLQLAGDVDGKRVDLSRSEKAKFLGLRTPVEGELSSLKRHVVEDLLAVHAPPVARTLFAVAHLAVLFALAGPVNRFAVWLRGRSGVGKSHTAKLFMNFFGDYPVGSTRFASWTSTANSLEREGHYFKDAMYLIDDYKPDVIDQRAVVRILQTNADGGARMRLRTDGTPNPSREIRGLIVSTGEDIPEHSASALARTVVVPVPGIGLDRDRYDRCVRASGGYSALMMDFVRFVLAEGWAARFGEVVRNEQRRFNAGIEGRPNAVRVANNVGLLAAAFRVAGAYYGDVWQAGGQVVEEYARGDLIALRDGVLAGSRDQRASDVFLFNLADLLEARQVRISGWRGHSDGTGILVGVFRRPRSGPDAGAIALSIGLCLAQVNDLLRRQRRPELVISHQALIDEFRSDGRLLGQDFLPLAPDCEDVPTVQQRIGQSNLRCILVAPTTLTGEQGCEGDGGNLRAVGDVHAAAGR